MEMPPEVQRAVDGWIGRVDEAMPGKLAALYVVGSTALGAFTPGRSDIDFVAVLNEPSRSDLDALRRAHRRMYAASVGRSVRKAPWSWPLVCNGVYIRADDFARPPVEVVPIAGHVSSHFEAGRGFDVNPVTWRTLARHGIAVRGPSPAELTIHDDDGELRAWNRSNLLAYWRPWAERVRGGGRITSALAGFKHLSVAWGVLGAPRLHCTIATGEIISKEQAGEYALETFGPAWHPLIRSALAYWRGDGGIFTRAGTERIQAADFVAMVVDSAASI